VNFTDFEIDKINKVAKLFPMGTEISVAKIADNNPYYYGVANSEKGINSIENSNAIFEIGSLTKVLTSSVLAKMSINDMIKIDEPINSVLPFALKDNEQITFRELATHTSGLPSLPPGIFWGALFKNKGNPYKNYSENKLVNYLANDLKLKRKGKVSYSNLGAGLLGYVLSTMLNRSYNDLLIEELFTPLNMTSSTTNRKQIKNRLVQGLNTKGQPTSNWDLNIIKGAGAVLSTTEDLVKFVLANFDSNNRVLEYQRQVAFNNGSECLALGWIILDIDKKDECLYFHNGGTGGYSSTMLLNIKTQNAFIILSNISGFHKLKGQKVDGLTLSLMGNTANKT